MTGILFRQVSENYQIKDLFGVMEKGYIVLLPLVFNSLFRYTTPG